MYHDDRTDKKAELETVQRVARECGAYDAIICNHWARGGAGAIDLANAVDRACNQPAEFKFLYDLNVSSGIMPRRNVRRSKTREYSRCILWAMTAYLRVNEIAYLIESVNLYRNEARHVTVLLLQLPLEEKIATIARQIYGADGIELSDEATKRMELFKKQVPPNTHAHTH